MPELESTALSLTVLALLLATIFIFALTKHWTPLTSSISTPVTALSTSEISDLRIYPIKSCRGLSLRKSTLRMTGLDLDRTWMFVDASTKEFLSMRQTPELTLINTAIDTDTDTLVLSVTGIPDSEVRIPAHPSPAWLAEHTRLTAGVKVWETVTDGYVYGPEVNGLFSRFLGKEVALVYKGPMARVLQGNGDPRILGRTQTTNFADMHPVLIGSEASIEELNGRLERHGDNPITIERFRPNIVVKCDKPWTEDSWKVVRISDGDATLQSKESGGEGGGKKECLNGSGIDIDVVARCTRCQLPNVDPDTARKHAKQPWNTLMTYRRIDEGMKYRPCFGMLSAPRSEGRIEVGMKFEVLEETDQHRYIKGL